MKNENSNVSLVPIVGKFPAVVFDVRYFLDENGMTWWVGKDVANILGYQNHRDALKNHVDDEDKRESRIATPFGGPQKMIIINESGLYSLILGSKLPNAKNFKRWVTSEVLPSIRRTGKYEMPKVEVIEEPPTVKVITDEDDSEIEREKFIMEAWSWFTDVLDTNDLSATEQLILLQWIRVFYKNFLKPIELSSYKLAKMLRKDERTVKAAIVKLTQKKLYPPPFNMQDLMFFKLC